MNEPAYGFSKLRQTGLTLHLLKDLQNSSNSAEDGLVRVDFGLLDFILLTDSVIATFNSKPSLEGAKELMDLSRSLFIFFAHLKLMSFTLQ